VPGATAAVVVTAPVAVSSAMPAGHAPDTATVASPPAPSVAAAPFTLSFAATFAIGVPGVPATALPTSASGWMLAVTFSVSVAVAQVGGVSLSHNSYGMP
jgi:hypothetical protein